MLILKTIAFFAFAAFLFSLDGFILAQESNDLVEKHIQQGLKSLKSNNYTEALSSFEDAKEELQNRLGDSGNTEDLTNLQLITRMIRITETMMRAKNEATKLDPKVVLKFSELEELLNRISQSEPPTKWAIEDFGKSMRPEILTTFVKRMVDIDKKDAAEAFADAIGTLPTFDDVKALAQNNKLDSTRFGESPKNYAIRAWIAANDCLTIDEQDGVEIDRSSLHKNLDLAGEDADEALAFHEEFKIAYKKTLLRLIGFEDDISKADTDANARRRLKSLDRENLEDYVKVQLSENTEESRRNARVVQQILKEMKIVMPVTRAVIGVVKRGWFVQAVLQFAEII